jgi:hypothetical protein
MRGMYDWQTAAELLDRRIRGLERAQRDHELSESDEDELKRLYLLRERLERASIKAIEDALDELDPMPV